MRPLRPRFTVRRLMVAVAVLAILLGGYVELLALKRRAAAYRERARSHADIEAVLRSIAEKDGYDSPIDISPGPGLRSVRFPLHAVAAHESLLRSKYERAARYPWLPVDPDTPAPLDRPGTDRGGRPFRGE